jgi:transposase
VSGYQRLRLIRQTPCGQGATPQVLGIDDWAFRKRHSYGTILVDMERHCVVDLLPDCADATVAKWLQQHPEVTIVCHDRGQVYIDGVTAGAPQAAQIADRFHLLRNLYEVLIKVCERRPLYLKAVAHEVAASAPAASAPQASESTSVLSPREQRFQQVKQLQSLELSQRAAARQVGLDRRMIVPHFRLQRLRPRAPMPQRQSATSAY